MDLPFVGAILATNEIILGSILQGLRVPFGGQTMSLIQITFMSIVSLKANSYSQAIRNPFYIASSSSLLKTISPAGNKLGPMLSIWMQGLLFCIGVIFFGHNFFGRLAGSTLSALWAFIQPVLTLYIFFGTSLIEGLQFYSQKISKIIEFETHSILYILIAAVFIKLILAIVAGSLIPAFYHEKILSRSSVLFYKNKAKVNNILNQRSQQSQSTYKLALMDLCKPVYLFSFVLGITFFCFSASNYAQVIWLSLRPLAVAYLFFLASRSRRISSFAKKALHRKNSGTLYRHFLSVMEYLTLDSQHKNNKKCS